MTSTFRELDAVVLINDIESSGLRAGDLGAVVHVHASDSFEVEFVTASGKTESLLTLSASDIRPVRDDDLLSVRPTTTRHGVA